LIVLIDHAHRTQFDDAKTFVLTLSHPSDAALRTARQAIGDGRWPVRVPKASAGPGKGKTCSKI
jgi:hypothetical protein